MPSLSSEPTLLRVLISRHNRSHATTTLSEEESRQYLGGKLVRVHINDSVAMYSVKSSSSRLCYFSGHNWLRKEILLPSMFSNQKTCTILHRNSFNMTYISREHLNWKFNICELLDLLCLTILRNQVTQSTSANKISLRYSSSENICISHCCW